MHAPTLFIVKNRMVPHMDLPKRKPNRLKYYDYSSAGAYFVTVCTKDRKCLLGRIIVGATIDRPYEIVLSNEGIIADKAINNISEIYPSVTVDNYIVMPNHVHLLLQIHCCDNGRATHAPTISTVIQQMKGYVSKQAGYPVWQKLFHDHIIRNESDYLKIWEYIENNACKWEEDCFYVPD